MDWIQKLQFLATQNGWSLLISGIFATLVTLYLLFYQWRKYKTYQQRKGFLYPFIFLSWFVTAYGAFGTAIFQHYLMTVLLIGCLALQIVLFLHRIRTESTTQA